MKRFLAGIAVSAFPLLALAQTYSPGQGVKGLFDFAGTLLNRIVPLIIAVAVAYFIWNVFQYIIRAEEDQKEAAKTHMIWGIVGLFAMVSVWGLVAILQSTFGTSGVQSTIGGQLPQI